MLTEKDKKLIEEAYKVPYTEWYLIDENAAETPEGKARLHSIASSKYHTEEYHAGLL